ncbi:MAG: NADH-quinone oxidoreductase subunit N [Elusimicrobia bacterium]|nr:NADH-quinone oxidoreductase subunit N [Elusimicrobiota bacterium]MDE2236592.1 NADH-quinone oxidoreductase subunit N [Elusimicrobiota bacterium]MDE2425452.1 NADH-quinone oxidoreductase subunit N [Elusimicrobiota bacterium]
MSGLHLLFPEVALSVMALGVMLADLFIAARHGRVLYHLGWIASIVALLLVGVTISDPARYQGVGTLWSVDPMSQFFKMLVLLTTVLCLLLGLEYEDLPPAHAGAFNALLLLSTAGLMFLVSAVDLLEAFVALELVSLSSFILVGFERSRSKSNEGAIKYFLFGAFSSAIMAFGISLFYGVAGTTRLIGLSRSLASNPVFLLAVLLILLGFAFKASIAPMHFWVPDAYEGAPTPVTAYLSIAPKIAAMAVLLRVFTILLPASALRLTGLLALLAALTMTIGNFTAFFQDNVKRLLAYSSIAQAGYIMIGIVAGNTLGLEGVMLYSFIYVAMNIGAFAVAQLVASQAPEGAGDRYGLSSFDGLAQRSFGLALAMAFFLLSLSGIPPLAGFIGKFYIFSAAVQSGHYWLAACAVVNSVVSVYYYMKIAYHMFFMPAPDQVPLRLGPYLCGGLAVAIAGVVIFGVYPEPLVASVQASAQYLP